MDRSSGRFESGARCASAFLRKARGIPSRRVEFARSNWDLGREREKKVRQALFYARELVFSYDLH